MLKKLNFIIIVMRFYDDYCLTNDYRDYLPSKYRIQLIEFKLKLEKKTEQTKANV